MPLFLGYLKIVCPGGLKETMSDPLNREKRRKRLENRKKEPHARTKKPSPYKREKNGDYK